MCYLSMISRNLLPFESDLSAVHRIPEACKCVLGHNLGDWCTFGADHNHVLGTVHILTHSHGEF